MIKLEIVTPEKKVFDETVESVTVPTATGEVGILPNHAPLISALKSGILTISNKGTSERMVVSGGFVEVSTNKVSVLTDVAEKASEVDAEAARAELAEAQKVLSGSFSGSEEEFAAENERLERAQARLAITAGK